MNIAFWGAFDWESLGDSMFPAVLGKILQERVKIERIFLFSPTELDVSYNNNGHVYSLGSFGEIHEKYRIDWIIICGGELLHDRPIKYKLFNGEEYYTEPGIFWKKAAEYHREYQVPVVVNLVGVPYEFEGQEKEELLKCMESFEWVSVRDRFSGSKLVNAGINAEKIKTFYDGLLLFNRYYSFELLENIRDKVKKKYQIPLMRDYVVLQYDTTKKLDLLSDVMRQVSETYRVDVVLLPVNRCHSDVEVSSQLYERSSGMFISVEAYLQPVEIMSIIAGAKVFIGTSFHGSIIAMSYGVNCIALDMYPEFVSKLDGLYEDFGIYRYLVNDIKYLKEAFGEVWCNSKLTTQITGRLEKRQDELIKYYDKLGAYLEGEQLAIIDTQRGIFYNKEKWKKSTLEVRREDGTFFYYNAIGKVRNGCLEFVFHIKEVHGGQFKWYSYLERPIEIYDLKIEASNGMIKAWPEGAEEIGKGKWQFGGLMYDFRFFIKEAYDGVITLSSHFKELPPARAFKAVQYVLNNKEAHLELLLESERELQREVNTQKKQVENLIQDLNICRQEKKSLQKEMEGELSNLNAHIDEMNNGMRNLNAHIDEMNNGMRNMQNHINNLENVQKSILESRKWKLLCEISKIIPGRKK